MNIKELPYILLGMHAENIRLRMDNFRNPFLRGSEPDHEKKLMKIFKDREALKCQCPFELQCDGV